MSEDEKSEEMISFSPEELLELGVKEESAKLSEQSTSPSRKVEAPVTMKEADYDLVFKRKIDSILNEISPSESGSFSETRYIYHDDLIRLSNEVIDLRRRLSDMEDAMRNIISHSLSVSKQIKELKK